MTTLTINQGDWTNTARDAWDDALDAVKCGYSRDRSTAARWLLADYMRCEIPGGYATEYIAGADAVLKTVIRDYNTLEAQYGYTEALYG